MQSNNVWVIVPIAENRDPLWELVVDLRSRKYFVVLVDDGCSPPISLQSEDDHLHLIRHDVNLGQGAALRTGMKFALEKGADYLVTFDADGQHRVEDVSVLLEPLLYQAAEVSLGSRFLPDGAAVNISTMKWLILKLGLLYTYATTDLSITDTHNGLRAFTRTAAKKISITKNRRAHASEILEQISRHRLRYCERPVVIRYPERQSSAMQVLRDAIEVLLELHR